MEEKELRIDIAGVLKSRAPKVARFIPRVLVRRLEELVCQERMNRLLVENKGKKGAEFSRGILKSLSIDVDVYGTENLPEANAESQRVIYVSNHPLGGLDGMALIDFISRQTADGNMKFIVNDLLMHIVPLANVFLPVNTVNNKGVQSRDSAKEIDMALKSDMPVAIFPAGLCSRLVNGKVQDLQWNKMFVNKAATYKRDIIPLYFSGENSGFFYKFANIRKRLGIPVNLEMGLLPKEVFRNEGKSFRIIVGPRIEWQSLRTGTDSRATADEIKKTVYNLPLKYQLDND